MEKFASKFSRASQSPGFLLWKLSNLHQRLQRKGLEEVNLTPSQFSVLACYFFLSKKTKYVTQSAVCHHSGIDKMFVSDLTKTLLKKGYVKKYKNKEDRRSHSIKITTKGATVCNKALRIVEELDLHFFSKTKRSKDLLEIMQELTGE